MHAAEAIATPLPRNAPTLRSEATIDAREVARSFGARRALVDVSLAVGAGEIHALLGPNGAGKTTLLRLLAGLLRPTSGHASIGGTDVRTDTTVRGRVGLISHQTMLYPALTALENVMFAAQLHGVHSAREASLNALETLGIADRAHALVRTLSRGMQQRVSIARAIVHGPPVMLLDEPYTGLDANGAAALSRLLHGLRSGGATMVVVTHNVAEGLAVATHAGVMLSGKLVRFGAAASSSEEFTRDYRSLVGVRDDLSPVAAA